MQRSKRKQTIVTRLSSVARTKKEIEKWAECTSKFIIGDGDRDLNYH